MTWRDLYEKRYSDFFTKELCGEEGKIWNVTEFKADGNSLKVNRVYMFEENGAVILIATQYKNPRDNKQLLNVAVNFKSGRFEISEKSAVVKEVEITDPEMLDVSRIKFTTNGEV